MFAIGVTELDRGDTERTIEAFSFLNILLLNRYVYL